MISEIEYNIQERRCEICGAVVGNMSERAWLQAGKTCGQHAEEEE